MKYYAVTDDPNELMHYGVKGMKWGVIRTDAQLGHPKKPAKPRSTKPKSDAYISASSKLRKMMSSGIQKAQSSWKEYNSPESKAIRDYKRGERLFEKHVQLARQGRLKYKGISDSEVERITDRLYLENRARQQSGNEKQGFMRRLGESAGNGFIQGFGQGVSARTSEWLGRGAKLKTQRMMTEQQNALHEAQAKRDFKRSMREQKARDEYQSDKADREKRAENEELYKALIAGNRDMGYDRVYGNGGGSLNYKASNRATRRLSNAELRARITNLEDTKKLYGSSQDAAIKALGGQVTDEYKDPDGTEHKVTYSKGNAAKLFGPAMRANERRGRGRKVSPTRAGNSSGATEEDLERMERQMNSDARGSTNNTASAASTSSEQQPTRKTKTAPDRESIRAAIREQGTTPVISETERYRQGMRRLLDEAEARDRKRNREEGFAYYEARRLSREANPDPYLPSAPTRAMVEASKRNAAYKKEQERLIRAATRDAKARYQQEQEALEAQARTARESETRMFNNRTLPSETFPNRARRTVNRAMSTVRRRGNAKDMFRLRG